ncbi:glutamine--fructose-6-phosphate transaminase [Pseudomonas duriflava]|uniref:Glutamine--fructose-6-phosphate transaminase n=1 Tax=Pseudomonas duriflava TaxID=459528 RepID=A0A562QIG1_9PSED|nr:SIS domain-containing protein [Pseudomonas duriflava]TWI56558.1 glutamine--fructose-6-phosphate transaminase [Pseudomonas duriflava]
MTSLMHEEAASARAAVVTQLQASESMIEALAEQLRREPPAGALTVARGSSDHAASYFAYLAMQRLGIPVASLPMSLITLRKAPLQVNGYLALALSQSGRSPDLIDTMRALGERGALTAALVNAPDSPLASVCTQTVPLSAGEERSVAATKSFIATLSASARLIAHWQADAALLEAGQRLPDDLQHAWELDWAPALDALKDAQRCMVVGRGLGMSIALEAALKFKETSVLQGEAFSGAEIKHGPMALIEDGYPLLIFAPRGPEQAGLLALADEMRQRGAHVLLAAPTSVPGHTLPLAEAGHPDLDPILAIQSFYRMAAALAEARGLNPDQPPHLQKVTCTH